MLLCEDMAVRGILSNLRQDFLKGYLFVPDFDIWQFSKNTGWIRQLSEFRHLRKRMMPCGITEIVLSGNGYISIGTLPVLPTNLI